MNTSILLDFAKKAPKRNYQLDVKASLTDSKPNHPIMHNFA